MAVRKLRIHPDPVLRERCTPVTSFDQELHQLLDDLGESMYAHKGLGLAAPQIGVPVRALVVDVDQREGAPRLLEVVNPELVATSPETVVGEEGCLSFPDEFEKVKRPLRVTLRALDRHGQPWELTGEGMLARALLHEMDHLEGKLFIDHLSRLKRSLVERRMRKLQRAAS
ncbi:MAG TPA: peptide deformylase [Myxococcota bacterium]|nr:peptide deformylase [Myxococcota bacterium]HRY93318.1 peptide deformylase [Myxococcota bacterium]HSA19883.1 peptide deformylase [Myxococcota bacterium]